MRKTRDWSIRRETEIEIDVVFRNGLLSSCVLPFLEKVFFKMSLISSKKNTKHLLYELLLYTARLAVLPLDFLYTLIKDR